MLSHGATRSLCKIKLMQYDQSVIQGYSFCHGKNQFRTYRMYCYMLSKVHLIHRQAQNTFCLIGLILHVFKTDTLNSSVLLQQGQQPKLHSLVANTGQNEKQKIHQVSDLWTFGTFFLIAHAAFLDSGSFCKTKIAKKSFFFFLLLKG